MSRFLASMLLIVLSASCGDGEVVCTEIGCTDGWTLRLQPTEDTLAPGVYALNTTVDGVRETCSWEVRLACDGGGACVVDGDCTNTVFTPGEVAVSFGTTPATIEVEVTRGGLAIVSETVTPTYQETRPNGPDCEPACRQGVVSIAVP